MKTIFTATPIFLAACALATCFAAENDSPFPLGGDRFLFLDKFLLDHVSGAHLVVNPPRQIKLVMIADKPWEVGGITSYGNVLWDPYANVRRTGGMR